MTERERKYLILEPWVAWSVFFILLVSYWSCVPPTVSFWDCPEYVSAAYLLEVGHPPGNPFWMLVERMFTLFVPGRYAALAINLSSGLFTAFAGFFLAKTIFRVGLWVLLKLPRWGIPAPVAAAGGALVGALAFGWCDSAWYSAIEAEVYAMSIFMSALCIWLMAKWAGTSNRQDSWRLLILIAYIFGLSIGVHQLNLLCIPALAMVWAVKRNIHSTMRLTLIFLLSLAVVGCVLMGIMPSTIALAARFELFTVNLLGWPALSGVALYVAMLTLSLLIALTVTRRSDNRLLMAAACYPAIFLSGIFIFAEHFAVGAIVSAAVALLLVSGSNFQARRLCLSIWMLALLLTGYSSYALIPIRGSVPSPANAAMPGEPFSFAAYQSREQYGGKPLLYGPTVFSKPMLREDFDTAGNPQYRFYRIDYGRPQYVLSKGSAHLRDRIPGLSAADSLRNERLSARGGDAYLIKGLKASMRKTPELDMWFPRITGTTPYDIEAYADWIGMTKETMAPVDISEAIDSTGKAVGKIDATGKRVKGKSFRPTYLQNLEWLASYQTGYMYWRYLLWNFAGRQNDRPSQGEVQHGNFITGFPAIDNAMLGAEEALPPEAGSDNPGRNRYWLLPLLLGIIGIGWLLKSRRRGMQVCAVAAILFVMTGLAIVIYLNQDPGEPRERDYSFLGSFWVFALWIGFGAIMIARKFKSVWGFMLPLGIVAWMGYENYDDHDRTGRTAARQFALNMLSTLDKDAIIFVNGDNYTFPLWYAQEVEGIRRDVRVVNLAYLSQPVYAANLMRDWRESAALQTTLRRADIVYDALRTTKPGSGRDTLWATAALDSLRHSSNARFPGRFVKLNVGDGTTAVYDLNTLRDSKSYIDFGRLMMFDIIATNSESATPRPIYWIGALGADKRIGLDKYLNRWMFGYRFGIMPDSKVDSMLIAAADKLEPLSPRGKKVYHDHAPALQISAQRAAITAAARRLLNHGNTMAAVNMARKADMLPGTDGGTFIAVAIGDSAFRTRAELAKVMLECADSLAADTPYKQALKMELRARGSYHLKEFRRLRRQWELYRAALPPRLRGKMSPTY